MSLSIKNPETARLVRQLADLTGSTQTGAVEDAVRRRLEEVESGATVRTARAESILASIRAGLTDAQRDALRAADHDLYGPDGLPR